MFRHDLRVCQSAGARGVLSPESYSSCESTPRLLLFFCLVRTGWLVARPFLAMWVYVAIDRRWNPRNARHDRVNDHLINLERRSKRAKRLLNHAAARARWAGWRHLVKCCQLPTPRPVCGCHLKAVGLIASVDHEARIDHPPDRIPAKRACGGGVVSEDRMLSGETTPLPHAGEHSRKSQKRSK